MNSTTTAYYSIPTPAPRPSASKRHSLNISIGPRPLHLVDGNAPYTSPSPLSTPSRYSSSPAGRSESPSFASNASVSAVVRIPRRQSSISYNVFNDREKELGGGMRSPAGARARHVVSKSVSHGGRSPFSLSLQTGERSGVGSAGNTELKGGERTPVTLAEKHADLLQFIAQKESKCLELRSQLATHESELLQLKRKWERIISRGFERSQSNGDVLSASTNGHVLEGIKESVQGVSRFLAAGLGELSSASPARSPSPSPAPSTPASPSLRSTKRQSVSSASTSATKSTRLSDSSASSVWAGDESIHESLCEEEGDVEAVCASGAGDGGEDGQGDGCQELMVHDTGATPTVSPNPVFAQQQQHRASLDEQERTTLLKLHRRKSRDRGMPQPLGFGSPQYSPTEEVKQTSARAKRMSVGSISGGLAPVSSIPGLGIGTMSVGGASITSPSWMGSVGKKWEELQKGSTFSKSQKRASILLSDVSQSIVSALSSPPPLASSSNIIGNTTTPHSKLKSSTPLRTTPIPNVLCGVNPSPQSPAFSLLDDDDGDGLDELMAQVMTPDSRSGSASAPATKTQSTPKLSLSTGPANAANGPPSARSLLEDDEWNW